MESKESRIYDSAQYIKQYYSSPEGNSEENLQDPFETWMAEAFSIVPQCEFGIEIGCGPVLTLAAFSSRKVKNIILTEYNTDCFRFIESWMKDDQSQFKPDWSKHFGIISKLEGNKEDIAQRLRKSILFCQKIDLTTPSIFQYPFFRKVDIITSSLCIEAVATSNESYKGIIANLKKFLNPNGYIFLIGVLEETFYMVGEQRLPCFEVTQQLLNETMSEYGFKIIKLNSLRPQNPPNITSDFKGLFSILAQLTQ